MGNMMSSSESQPFKISLTAPPSAGKGTTISSKNGILANFSTKENPICQLSTGDLLRAAIRSGTENGKKAKIKMDAGQLVDTDIVFAILGDAMKSPECKGGWILDGMPRSLEQAELLDKKNFGLKRVVQLDVSDETVVKRGTGRLYHPGSGRTYHKIFNPPKVEMIDDVSGEPLAQRSDDTEPVIRKRLNTFHNQTQGALDYYKKQGILSIINGEQDIKSVCADTVKELAKYFPLAKK